MAVNEGGASFGFCPGKATWEPAINSLFSTMLISAENGCLYSAGGISDQPEWFVELLGWFLPRYNDLRFYARAKSILGEANEAKSVAPGRKL